MQQRQDYKRVYHEVKADEIKDEIAKIEIQKIKCSARNQNLLANIQRVLDQDEESNQRLAQMRKNLENSKRNFLQDLNRKDPNWQEKMKNRK